MSRAKVTMAALAVCGVLTAGCQSNAAPPPLESTSPSPMPSPSPTQAAAPTLPPEAEGTDEAAAKAFVRHYFDQLNWSMNMGDTEQFRALSRPGCESCRAIASNIDETYAAGGSISTEGWQVKSITAVPMRPPHIPMFDLGIVMKEELVTSSTGAEPKSFTGGKQPMTIQLRYFGASWRVARLDQVS